MHLQDVVAILSFFNMFNFPPTQLHCKVVECLLSVSYNCLNSCMYTVIPLWHISCVVYTRFVWVRTHCGNAEMIQPSSALCSVHIRLCG